MNTTTHSNARTCDMPDPIEPGADRRDARENPAARLTAVPALPR
jgi:hypothetical protein